MQQLKIKWFITRTIMSLKGKSGMTRDELNDSVLKELIKQFPLTNEDSDSWFQYICELTEKLEFSIS